MPATDDDLRAIERLHVRAWPALETANIDGWLWRRSGGGSNRANSVATVRFTGYVNNETTVAMRKPLAARAAPAGVDASAEPSDDWRAVYLGAITENRRVINTEILKSIPAPRAFLASRRNGRVISPGLGVAAGGFGAVECMATHADVRW